MGGLATDIASTNWLEAQQGLIGSMLLSSEIVPKVLSEMQDSDFRGPALVMFQAFRHLFQQGMPVDVISVAEKVGPDYTPYIMQLMECTPTAYQYPAYMEAAKRQAKVYRLQEIGQLMAESHDIDELQKLVEEAVSLNMQRSGMRAISMREAIQNFISRHDTDEPPDYLHWHIKGLRTRLPLEVGDFIIIGGRPSAGKTAFALQTAWEMAKTKKVAFFSLETNDRKLTDRQVADICNVPLQNIKWNRMGDEHWDSVVKFAQSKEVDRTLDIVDKSSASVSDIAAFSAARQYEVIFIDYLQILDSGLKNATDTAHATKISKDLHRFAQTSNCAVVALSQLNRGGEGSAPDMKSLRDSGQLEQDADAILFLYLKDEEKKNGSRILKCAKNKDGERFRMELSFDGQHQRFFKPGQEYAQMQILPGNTPVPFEEG